MERLYKVRERHDTFSQLAEIFLEIGPIFFVDHYAGTKRKTFIGDELFTKTALLIIIYYQNLWLFPWRDVSYNVALVCRFHKIISYVSPRYIISLLYMISRSLLLFLESFPWPAMSSFEIFCSSFGLPRPLDVVSRSLYMSRDRLILLNEQPKQTI